MTFSKNVITQNCRSNLMSGSIMNLILLVINIDLFLNSNVSAT